jgi:hypothetical protein
LNENIQDFWKEVKAATRRFCRGWGTNFQAQTRKNKSLLLGKIKALDVLAESNNLNQVQWQERYDLEAELEQIYSCEELQLRRQSGIKWTLKGDTNNKFFHGVANGRKRKCTIFSLEDNGIEIRDPAAIRMHVDNFYKNLFGAEVEGEISLGGNFWENKGRLTDEEALELVRPFSLTEIDEALMEMEVSSAPGPDGLPVGFYRAFWPELKHIFLEMFQALHRGELNLHRLNYGMISLMPKSKEANNIRQFRSICVLNIDYKIFTKVLTKRLSSLVDKLISKSQTAFIPGRFILEGVITLHEILHELRLKKTKGVILKLDFEKAYDKVHWSFLIEVLKQKNFSAKWIEWVKQAVEGAG